MAGPGNAKGFVLVTTLWALAALALLGAYINHVVTADVEFAIEDKRVFEAELARRSTEATVTYLLATGRMNHHALILEGTQRFSDPRRDRTLSRFRDARGAASDRRRVCRPRRRPLLASGRGRSHTGQYTEVSAAGVLPRAFGGSRRGRGSGHRPYRGLHRFR